MAKPNYAFEKRQRELAKSQKKELKSRRKLERDAVPEVHPATDVTDAPPSPEPGNSAAKS